MGPRGTMGDGRAEKAEAKREGGGKERVTGCNNNIKKKGGGGPLVDERGGGGGGILWMDGWMEEGKTERKRRIEWLKCEKLPFGCRPSDGFLLDQPSVG